MTRYCLEDKTLSWRHDIVLNIRCCLWLLWWNLHNRKTSILSVLSSRQFLVFKTMSCFQDYVLSSRQCLVFKTMSCFQDNVLVCLVFKTLSCLQDNAVSFALYKLRFCLVKCGLKFNFVLPKVFFLVMLIQVVPTFCRPEYVG